jgi:hypothetical protein
MTPSQLLKLNIKYYKYLIFTLLISTAIGLFISINYRVNINNKYEILIVEDINTKFLIDKVHEKQGYNSEEYYKYLKNYTVSKFINSTSNKKAELEINRKGDYSINVSFKAKELNKIEEFDTELSKFLLEIQKSINNQITKHFQFRVGKSAVGIEANSKLFYKKESNKKGNNPLTIFFITIVMGVIIMNFIIILENPPKE